MFHDTHYLRAVMVKLPHYIKKSIERGVLSFFLHIFVMSLKGLHSFFCSTKENEEPDMTPQKQLLLPRNRENV